MESPSSYNGVGESWFLEALIAHSCYSNVTGGILVLKKPI